MVDKLKKEVALAIDKHAEDIYQLAENFYSIPELGFKELKTSELVKKQFEMLGLDHSNSFAVTGARADLKGKNEAPKIALMGEMDSVVCRDHPSAELNSGAVHACGHHAQLAVMFGAAMGLQYSGAMNHLYGSIPLIAAPGEEFIDLDFRDKLIESGKLKYFGGKQELISLGVFDDIDIAAMMHLIKPEDNNKVYLGAATTGFIAKKIKFSGRLAHAAEPYEGINSLNAALLAVNAVNANREMFRDEDCIRFHYIITKGGDAVNVVPNEVFLEAQVRSNNSSALDKAGEIVNRCFASGALSVGADVEIRDIPGYLPLISNKDLTDIFKSNCSSFVNANEIRDIIKFPASFDFGDVSHLMPGLHPFFAGIEGGLHSKDFKVVDKELAYIVPAKTIAFTLIDLLFNNAEKAKKVIENHTPNFTKEEYIKLLENRKRIFIEKNM